MRDDETTLVTMRRWTRTEYDRLIELGWASSSRAWRDDFAAVRRDTTAARLGLLPRV